ncbi:MAG: hypothetical protein Q9225_003310 [Loekoesia sp. 1 TL-2023]
MATQAMLIADTIAGMKRAVARSRDQVSSDSEDSIDRFTNRGNKLKRKARYVHEGQLDRPNGPKVYKRKIEHAGYYRDVISQNPQRYDENGDQLDDEEEDEEADAAAAEANPYNGIILQGIDDVIFDTRKVYEEIVRSRPSTKSLGKRGNLSEKTSLTSLEDTTVKITIEDRTLSEERERKAGAAVLSEQENGNNITQGPSESLSVSETLNEAEKHRGYANGVENMSRNIENQTTARQDFKIQATVTTEAHVNAQKADNVAITMPITTTDDNNPLDPEREAPGIGTAGDAQHMVTGQPSADHVLNSHDQKVSDGPAVSSTEGQEDVVMVEIEEPQAANDDLQPIAHRMTTRAQAQAVSDNAASLRTRSPSVASSFVPSIHPLFLIPSGACPDRDFGLPPDEAEATRRILMSYVQKQEEVCRGAEKLYNGLLKAGRMKKDVFDSCKAEGHVGEMSDGEDWYDKEEWGLEEDLRKGHDEEEDDPGTQHKKTRGRRA